MTPSSPTTPDPNNSALEPMQEYAAPAPHFHLLKYLTFLRRFWWVPVLTLILSLGSVIIYVLRWTQPTFVSNARMWETEKLRLPEGALFTEDPQNYIGTQTELLRSGKLSQMALARLRTSGTNTVPLDKEGKPLEVRIKVTQAPKSTVFMVEASSSKESYTRTYLDALMNEYMDYKKNVRKLVSGDTLASISEQVLRLERDLKADQDALTTFQRTNNLAILQEEGSIAGSYLARIKTQLSDYQLESKLLQATALEQEGTGPGQTNSAGSLMDSIRTSGSASASSSSATTERLTAYKEFELLKIQREKLSKNLRPKHPRIVKLDADIERGQKIIEMYQNHSREQLATAQQALKMRIDSVLASIKEWEVKVVDANSRIAEADRLKLNINRAQNLYDRLVNLLNNVDISRNIDQSTLAILEPASLAERTYKREIQFLTLAIFGGLAAGVGLIFLVAIRDDRLTSIGEVNEQIGDYVIGQIPEMPVAKKNGSLALLEDEDDRHMYAESYRNLRSAIHFFAVNGERPKVLLVTSAVPDEGKSTIAINLARALALGGSRVLLMDADLRKGHLHDLLGLAREPGLTEVLRQPDQLDHFIQAYPVPNLFFISCGSDLRNPGDLFLSAVFDEVLARLRQQFDYILIDSSPVFAADDATTLAPKVDATLFVLRSRFSRSGVVREALDLLYQRQAKILGLVINRVDASARSYYYYKYKGYHRKNSQPGKAES